MAERIPLGFRDFCRGGGGGAGDLGEGSSPCSAAGELRPGAGSWFWDTDGLRWISPPRRRLCRDRARGVVVTRDRRSRGKAAKAAVCSDGFWFLLIVVRRAGHSDVSSFGGTVARRQSRAQRFGSREDAGEDLGQLGTVAERS